MAQLAKLYCATVLTLPFLSTYYFKLPIFVQMIKVIEVVPLQFKHSSSLMVLFSFTTRGASQVFQTFYLLIVLRTHCQVKLNGLAALFANLFG